MSHKEKALQLVNEKWQELHGRQGMRILQLEAELKDQAKALEDLTLVAFVQGAAWWEYQKENATMWGSDKEKAFAVAVDRQANGTLGARLGFDSPEECDNDCHQCPESGPKPACLEE